MPISTPTLLTSGTNGSNLTAYSTASVTLTAGRLYLLALVTSRSGSSQQATVGGNGTWTEVATTEWGSGKRLSLYRCLATATATAAITITFVDTHQMACWFVTEIESGFDTGGTNGAAAIAQSALNTALTVTALSVPLAAFAAGGLGIGIFATDNSTPGTDIVPANGYTELGQVQGESPGGQLEVQYNLTDADPSATFESGNAAGIGVEIKSATAAPDAPSDLVATAASPSQIDLEWTDNSSDEASFTLQRSLDGLTGWAEVATPAANATTHSDSGLASNTSYSYRIAAVSAGGTSSWSNVASALTLLPPIRPLEPRMMILQPDIVFAAQVNLVSAVYPLDHLVYDTISAGSFGAIGVGMTIELGSTPGASDLGRSYVRKPATSTRVYVGRSSRGARDGELTVTNDAYITVYNERRVWAKIPYIAANGEIYKDSDIPVGDFTTLTPPVSNTGPGTAATIDAITGLINITFNGQHSFATADGATITTYAWDIADGTLVAGTLADDNIQATFPPGYRYVALTVVDSNSKPHTAYCLVYARDPANDDSVEIEIESHRIGEGGTQMTVRPLTDIPVATYREGAPCLVWSREQTATGDRDHMLLIGFLHNEPQSIRATRTGNQRESLLQLLDVAGKMDTLPGFPQSLANDASRDTELIPSITWSYMVNPTLDKYLHYLLLWHSTALEIADFVWTGTGALYQFVLLTSDGASLWNQIDQRARAFLPDYALTCDQQGRIMIVPDPGLRDAADRTAVIQAAIDENEYSEISFTSQPAPRIHWLRGSAILAGLTVPIATAFGVAPGDAPGQGVGESTQGEQLALSQAALNAAIGHRYARLNAPYSTIRLTLIQNDTRTVSQVAWREIEPAHKEWVTIELSAETAAQRGITFTTIRALPKTIDIRYNNERSGLTRTVVLEAEIETVGEPGVTVVKPAIPGVGEYTPPAAFTPPSFGLVSGQQQVVLIDESGNLYRTSNFQTTPPTWGSFTTLATNYFAVDPIYSFVVDPFSPGYIDGAGAINGYVATAAAIYRINDMFAVTPTATLLHTFATSIGSGGGQGHWRSIAAGFGRFFATDADNPWLMVVTNYGQGTGVRAIYSIDAGVTWSSEVQVSAFWDTTIENHPICIPGLWLSPRTPGLAFTSAFSVTGDPATGEGYKTTDWGATWAAMSDPDIIPGNRLAGTIHVPWPDNADEQLVYHGNHSKTPVFTYTTKRVQGTTITDISPSDGTRTYSPRLGLFGIRTYDNDRNYVAMAGRGNSVDALDASDINHVYVSSDGGDTWSSIYGPIANGGNDDLITEVAFAADDPNTIYMWGQDGTLKYTEDFGGSLLDKEGNLRSGLGATLRFVGLAGGAPPVGLSETIISDTTVNNPDIVALGLWNGSSNNAPPTGWKELAFDDGAWTAALEIVDAEFPPLTGTKVIAAEVYTSINLAATDEENLFRHSFVLPSGVATTATLNIKVEDKLLGAWVNDTLVGQELTNPGPGQHNLIFSVDTALLNTGDNVLALHIANATGYLLGASYSLEIA